MLTSNQLVRFIDRRPKLLTDEQLNQLVTATLDPATWGNPAMPPADLGSFAALRASVTSARRRRRTWALAVLLSPVAVAAASLLGLFR